MQKKQQKFTPELEAVKNLLIISLLKDGIDPKVITYATGIPEGTIRRKFPMALIKSEE